MRSRRCSRLASAALWICCAPVGAVAAPGVTQGGHAPGARAAGPSHTTSALALPRVAQRIASRTALHIVAFGSSSTEGVGATSPAATYPSQLDAYLSGRLPGTVEVVNAGVGGEDADDMARRLPRIIGAKPDLVVWQTGSNDPLRGVPVERFAAETRAGILAMRQAGIDVVLVNQQYCPALESHDDFPAFRNAITQIGADLGVPVVDRYGLMRRWLSQGAVKREALLSPDNLHMTDGGYAMLAKAIGEEILAAVHR
jgi:acyl-CoA thioesterase I